MNQSPLNGSLFSDAYLSDALLSAFISQNEDPSSLPVLAMFPESARQLRARQIARWLYAGVPSFDMMTDLPQNDRAALSRIASVRETEAGTPHIAEDGTIKLPIKLRDGACIEAVLLTDAEGRRTACLSTQAGCPLGCVFCKTGSLGFKRNLSAAEIAEQVFWLEEAAAPVSHIVVMGMGEPLLNLDELSRALRFLKNARVKGGRRQRNAPTNDGEHHQKSFQGAFRRITVSSSGIVDGIRALPDILPGVRLAVSITTADEYLRRRLMPVTQTNPLSRLKTALSDYQRREKKRITLEAALLGGINTREWDARRLAQFADSLNVIINLIPWNPAAGLSFDGKLLREPLPAEVEEFSQMLKGFGLKTEARREKGRTVEGACGQLGVIS
jgi:23S rRNA (adenine2503-C2)-methyltransferase